MTAPAPAGPTAHQRLRAATAADHERTDAAFGGFDLADRNSYAAFLRAHARVLPAIEAALDTADGLPAFVRRTPALLADLAVIGTAPPPALPFPALADPAAGWGVLYVMEGSRLGGAMLARSVREGLPRGFLDARHGAGEWRAFCAKLDAAEKSEGWFDRALAAARMAFGRYAEAAREDCS